MTFEKAACYLSKMGSDSSAFELTLPSRMEELPSVQRLVEKASRAFCLDEELSHWVELAVNECTINAIQHGNRADPTKNVFVRVSLDGETLEIIVEDEGDGFQLTDIPDPTDTENLLKPGGRGILIVQSFMDEVEVSCREGGGSRLRLIKRINDGQAS